MADADRAIGPTAGSASEAVQGPAPLQRPGRRGCLSREHWAVEPDVGRVADGVPRRVDRIHALGNAVVPQVAEVVGRRLMELAT
jgi:DNA (cytosine-5)-methyltransferase 1